MYDQSTELLEITSYTSNGIGLWYDSDRLTLEGVYLDEVTAYRARRRWIEALETNFLLEERQDFIIRVSMSPGSRRYSVRCRFASACGRYAFWRLTHHQAPEVQFVLETAHLPHVTFDTLAACGFGSTEGIASSSGECFASDQLYHVDKKNGVGWIGARILEVIRKFCSTTTASFRRLLHLSTDL